MGCSGDSSCTKKQACVNGKCVNPCDSKPCRGEQICEVVAHKANCLDCEFQYNMTITFVYMTMTKNHGVS